MLKTKKQPDMFVGLFFCSEYSQTELRRAFAILIVVIKPYAELF